jgi:hypothetical protein
MPRHASIAAYAVSAACALSLIVVVVLGLGTPARALAGAGASQSVVLQDALAPGGAAEDAPRIVPVSQIDCSQCRLGGRCPSICRIDCDARLKKYQTCDHKCPERGDSGSRECNISCQRFLRGCT